MLAWIWGYAFTYYRLLLLQWLFLMIKDLSYIIEIIIWPDLCIFFVWWVKYFYTSLPPPHKVPVDYIRKPYEC